MTIVKVMPHFEMLLLSYQMLLEVSISLLYVSFVMFMVQSSLIIVSYDQFIIVICL
jgi:hypothetical protein